MKILKYILCPFFVFGGNMKDCDFECYYRTEAGNCEQGGGECQEEDCVFWMDCGSCSNSDGCEI